ncbi:Tfp pilus assembly protein FimT/FimU [Methylophilus luteus]
MRRQLIANMRVVASRGFTLVELVVVIALAGVMVAVAAPRFANGDIFETRGDAGLLSSTLRYAQKTAIAQRRDVYAIRNAAVTPNTVRLCFDAACAQSVINPETGTAYVFTFSKSVTVSAFNNSLGFDALGRAIPNVASSYTVTNKNGAQSFTVNIEQDTGYIR